MNDGSSIYNHSWINDDVDDCTTCECSVCVWWRAQTSSSWWKGVEITADTIPFILHQTGFTIRFAVPLPDWDEFSGSHWTHACIGRDMKKKGQFITHTYKYTKLVIAVRTDLTPPFECSVCYKLIPSDDTIIIMCFVANFFRQWASL